MHGIIVLCDCRSDCLWRHIMAVSQARLSFARLKWLMSLCSPVPLYFFCNPVNLTCKLRPGAAGGFSQLPSFTKASKKPRRKLSQLSCFNWYLINFLENGISNKFRQSQYDLVCGKGKRIACAWKDAFIIGCNKAQGMTALPSVDL